MNAVAKTAIFRPQKYFSLLNIAFFHSTSVLERKRGSSPSSSVGISRIIDMYQYFNSLF